MTGVEVAEWQVRLAAAEELLELVDEELVAAQATVDRARVAW